MDELEKIRRVSSYKEGAEEYSGGQCMNELRLLVYVAVATLYAYLGWDAGALIWVFLAGMEWRELTLKPYVLVY